MKIFKLFLMACISAIIFTQPHAAEVKFVGSNSTNCPDVCEDAGLKPIKSGHHSGGRPLYLCTAEDGRGGYNFGGSHEWEKICKIGLGDKEQDKWGFHCVCISKEIDVVLE